MAVGNAPTALIKIEETVKITSFKPALLLPAVGFVNVVESKELMLNLNIPSIVAKGRVFNVAAAIINAMLYQAFPR